MMQAIQLLLVGGSGRMGQAIRGLAGGGQGHRVVRAVSRHLPEYGEPGVSWFTDLEEALRDFSGVVIDVSGSEGAAMRVDLVRQAAQPLVQGTTGLDEHAMEALRRLARERAVVLAPNLSPGVALLRRILRTALRAEGPSWDIAVLDRHHAQKKDAPSGTARLLTREIAAEVGTRHRLTTPEAVSIRQGGVVGEHTIHLAAQEEELVLTHRALDRRVFARGALLAAAFAAQAPPGLHGMDEVLGGAGDR